MRSYCALYVDVGYLLAAAATRVTGTSLRKGVVVSYPDLVARLIADAEKASGLPLLRLHWYDSGNRPGGTPDSTQEAIGMLPRVKLRLGRTSPQGEQKGVDLRIGLDLAAHGRNRSVDVIYLLSGDDDLSEAVEEAQSHGMQVVLMAVPDRLGRAHAVSRHLIRESDDLIVLDGSVVDDSVRVRQLQPDAAGDLLPAAAAVAVPLPGPRSSVDETSDLGEIDGPAERPVAMPGRPTPAVLAGSKVPQRPAAGTEGPGRVVWSSVSERVGSDRTAPAASQHELDLIDEVCRGVIATWSITASAADRTRLMSQRPFIPGDLDRALLLDLSARLDRYDVEEHLRFLLRGHFWKLVSEPGG
ncbi:NYN domain-containing protein [Terrabacter sp. MAHUQ-38]|uniref:NYN domain-containing protein n=1 Tax=unclassified Terrabacter TaxID=2630222 RepID=UPI00165DF048|nr:NYN domain-containing protein [Terrabacter sp. MAHUQ-38]MBC9820524.1 NYN domain-containing protein [Terrabacter sp. MAHUQ-38]